MKRILLAIAFTALVGCQTYDFEPVTPLAVGQTTQSKKIVAHQLKPNLMMLIDKSGSMLEPTSTMAPCTPTCGPGAGNQCPVGCPTRIGDLQKAMDTFLTTNGKVGRVGMAIFPSGGASAVCNPTTAADVQVPLAPPALADDDTALQMQADAVNAQIKLLAPAGGTPTAESLRFVGNNSPELLDPDRQDFVLLLTDGVPNCNQNNPNTCANAAACQCTTSSCGTPGGQLCSLGCLNADDSVTAVKELRTKNIKTIVIGFGACGSGSTSPDCANAPQTLNRMASEGGFARGCPMGTDAECQTMGVMDTCNVASKLCNQSFFAAANANELSIALKQISDVIGLTDICTYTLVSIPSDPKFLSVTVDGQSIQGCGVSMGGATIMGCNTWSYDVSSGQAKVTFQGSTCDKVKSATQNNPVNVDFRIVQSL